MAREKNEDQEENNTKKIPISEIAGIMTKEKVEFLKYAKKKKIDISDKDKKISEFKKFLESTKGTDFIDSIDSSYFDKLDFADVEEQGVKLGEISEASNSVKKSNSDEKLGMQKVGTQIAKMVKDGRFGSTLVGADFEAFCTAQNLLYDKSSGEVTIPSNSKITTLHRLESEWKTFAKTKGVDINADPRTQKIIDDMFNDINTRNSQPKVMITSLTRHYENFLINNMPDSVVLLFRSEFKDYCKGAEPDINSLPRTLDDLQSKLQNFVETISVDSYMTQIGGPDKLNNLLSKLKKSKLTYKHIYETGFEIGAYRNANGVAGKVKNTQKSFYDLFKGLHSHQIVSERIDGYESLSDKIQGSKEIFEMKTNLTDLFKDISSTSSLDTTPSEVSNAQTSALNKKIVEMQKKISEKEKQIESSSPSDKNKLLLEYSTLFAEQKELKGQLARLQEPNDIRLKHFDEIEDKYNISGLSKSLADLRNHNRSMSELDKGQKKLFAKALLQDKIKMLQTPENIEFMSSMGIDSDEHTKFVDNLFNMDSDSFEIQVDGKLSKVYFARDKQTDDLLKDFYSNPIVGPISLDDLITKGNLLYGVAIDLAKTSAENPKIMDFLYHSMATKDGITPMFKFYDSDHPMKSGETYSEGGEVLTENTKVTLTSDSKYLTEITKKSHILKKKGELTPNEQKELNYYENIINNDGKFEGYLSQYGPFVGPNDKGESLYVYDQPITENHPDRKIVGFLRNKTDQNKWKLNIDPNERNLTLSGNDLNKLVNSALVANTAKDLMEQDEEAFDRNQAMLEDINKLNQNIQPDAFIDDSNADVDVSLSTDLDPEIGEISEKEKFDKGWEEIAGKGKLELGAMVATFKSDESIIKGGERHYKRKITKITDDKIFLESIAGEINTSSQSVELPRNSKGISTFKNVLGEKNLTRYPKLSGNRETYSKEVFEQNTSEKILNTEKLLGKSKLKNGNFVNPSNESEKMVFVHKKNSNFKAPGADINSSSPIFFEAEQKGNKFKIKSKYLALEKIKNKDGTYSDGEKICEYNRDLEMDYASFIAFLTNRNLEMKSEPLVETEHKNVKDALGAKPEGLPSKPRTRISRKATGMTLKKWRDGVVSGLDAKTSDQADEMNHRAMNSGMFQTLSGLPFVGGILGDMHDKYKLERDGNIWKKIQGYIDTRYNQDIHHSLMIGPVILPLISKITDIELDDQGKPKASKGNIKHGVNLSYDERCQAFAALMYMSKKAGDPYCRGLANLAGSGFWVYAIYGEYMRKQFQIQKQALEKDGTGLSLTALAELEFKFMEDNIIGGKYHVIKGNPNEQFNGLYSRKMQKELVGAREALFGEDSWQKEYKIKVASMDFGRSLNEFNDNFGRNHEREAMGCLLALFDLAETAEQYAIVKKCLMMIMLTKSDWYQFNYDLKAMFQTKVLKFNFPPALLIMKGSGKQANILTSVMSVATGKKFDMKVNGSQYNPESLDIEGRGQGFLGAFGKNFNTWRDDNGSKVEDFLDMSDLNNHNIHYFARSKNRPLKSGNYELLNDDIDNLNVLSKLYDSSDGNTEGPNDYSTEQTSYKNAFFTSHLKTFGVFSKKPDGTGKEVDRFKALRNEVFDNTKKIKNTHFGPHQRIEFDEVFTRFMIAFGSFFGSDTAGLQLITVLRTIKDLRSKSKDKITDAECKRLLASYIMGPIYSRGAQPDSDIKRSIENMVSFFGNNIDMLADRQTAVALDGINDDTIGQAAYLFDHNSANVYLPAHQWNNPKLSDAENQRIQSQYTQQYGSKTIINDTIDKWNRGLSGNSWDRSANVINQKVEMLSELGRDSMKILYPREYADVVEDKESTSSKIGKIVGLNSRRVVNDPNDIGIFTNTQNDLGETMNKKVYMGSQSEVFNDILANLQNNKLSDQELYSLQDSLVRGQNAVFVPQSVRSLYSNPTEVPMNLSVSAYQIGQLRDIIGNITQQYRKPA